MENKVVLSFQDSLLRKSDVDTLSPSTWLNDMIISFAFEYFETIKFHSLQDQVCFVGPPMTQCLKLFPVETLPGVLAPLELESKDLTLFALNNNKNPLTAGGTHWSLFTLSVKDLTCHHYDTSRPFNSAAAQDLYSALNSAYNGRLTLEEVEVPQQTNSCDCGVYVIAMAEQICERISEHLPISLNSSDLNPLAIAEKRQNLKDLIYSLSTEEQK